ncbi:MAG TPA: hypothetical protein VNW30_08255 [Opitutaceae bacterium]|nr:hypothetical protein [Opitutaceae bacterium]
MASPHGYRIFGLNVLSEWEIPYWPAGGPPWEVRVERGEVPAELPGAEVLWDGAFHGMRGRCLLHYPEVGRILIEHGERVTVAPAAGAFSAPIAHMLGGTGFAMVLYQRGMLCLHASAVAWQGRAYLVMGPSGAGKSTTVSALLAHGGEFISDDVTAIAPGPGGGFFATPSFPSVRLLADSHGELAGRIGARGALDPVDEKIRLHYTGTVAVQPQPIARICFLESDETIARPRAEPILGQESVGALQRSLYRRRPGRIVADPARLAEMTIALALQVQVLRLTRPRHGFALEELCALVLG